MSANDMLKGINEIIQHSTLDDDELMHFRTKGSKNGEPRFQIRVNGKLKWTPLGLKRRREREAGYGDERDEHMANRDRAQGKMEKAVNEYDSAKEKHSKLSEKESRNPGRYNKRLSKLAEKSDKAEKQIEETVKEYEEYDYRLQLATAKKNMDDTGTAYYNPVGIKESDDNILKTFKDSGFDTEKLEGLQSRSRELDDKFAKAVSDDKMSEQEKKDIYKEMMTARRDLSDEIKVLDEEKATKDRHNKNIEERGGKKSEEKKDADQDSTSKTDTSDAEKKTDAPSDNNQNQPKQQNKKNKKNKNNQNNQNDQDDQQEDQKASEKKKSNTPDADEIAYYDPETNKPVLVKDVEKRKAEADRKKQLMSMEEDAAATEEKWKKAHPTAKEVQRQQEEEVKKAREEAKKKAEEEAKKARENAFNKSQATLEAVTSGAKGAESIAKSGSGIADLIAESQKGKMDADKKAEMDNMSDAELKQRVARLTLEQSYAKLNPSETQRRAEQAALVLDGLGHVAAITGNVSSSVHSIRKLLHPWDK